MDASIMIHVSAMAYSDQVIYQHLSRLIEEHGSETTISHAMICKRSGAPYGTVRRAVSRLLASGQVIGTFTPQIGYSYRIPYERATPSTRS